MRRFSFLARRLILQLWRPSTKRLRDTTSARIVSSHLTERRCIDTRCCYAKNNRSRTVRNLPGVRFSVYTHFAAKGLTTTTLFDENRNAPMHPGYIANERHNSATFPFFAEAFIVSRSYPPTIRVYCASREHFIGHDRSFRFFRTYNRV